MNSLRSVEMNATAATYAHHITPILHIFLNTQDMHELIYNQILIADT